MTPETIHPEGWAPALGYANGMLMPDGTLHIGGQIGWNKDKIFEAKDFIGQMEQCLRNIVEVVRAAGGAPEHIGRLTWYVKDKSDYMANQRAIGDAYRGVMGRHFPAMSLLVISDLLEDEALIEIEATAFIPR
ncbi:Enamine deaminase RidA, house cleaning of reactive enamine intermediates, YjgF/YER057c/UK114 family [Paracoccus isoporae]|uniref:Enamine deaminase RidA, house cleaning of reactive enamine intermediates, YjgF/YER057c/UK114 family n=1 Tax=Paracoccus isoporae TaxID=591205 RepID=A0A1G6V6A7_9RHOB|nr:RidA family protein [Paracoccus isoporae]SDD48913.1 Enamine deaminase RidA, house cleaning of reactive enamine intermediates, YjgF/YER057c/UK114 family [Paracoccus isoporae]